MVTKVGIAPTGASSSIKLPCSVHYDRGGIGWENNPVPTYLLSYDHRRPACRSAVHEDGEHLQSSDNVGSQADFTSIKIAVLPKEILLGNDADSQLYSQEVLGRRGTR